MPPLYIYKKDGAVAEYLCVCPILCGCLFAAARVERRVADVEILAVKLLLHHAQAFTKTGGLKYS